MIVSRLIDLLNQCPPTAEVVIHDSLIYGVSLWPSGIVSVDGILGQREKQERDKHRVKAL